MTRHDALAALLATLNEELRTALDAASATYAAATDPDSKAENKYDTRSLEASYLARGQSRRVIELREAIAAIAALESPARADSVGLGSLVTVAGPGGADRYLLAPVAGGTTVNTPEGDFLVITPASPLGARLMGRAPGDVIPGRPGTAPLHLVAIHD